jgi:hypothetical protein
MRKQWSGTGDRFLEPQVGASAMWLRSAKIHGAAFRALAQPKSDLSDFGLKVPNSGRPEFRAGHDEFGGEYGDVLLGPRRCAAESRSRARRPHWYSCNLYPTPKVLDRRSGLADHGATAFTDANDRGARQVQAPNRDAVIRPSADRPKSARLRRLGFVYLSLKHAGQTISHLLKPLRFVEVEMTA